MREYFYKSSGIHFFQRIRIKDFPLPPISCFSTSLILCLFELKLKIDAVDLIFEPELIFQGSHVRLRLKKSVNYQVQILSTNQETIKLRELGPKTIFS